MAIQTGGGAEAHTEPLPAWSKLVYSKSRDNSLPPITITTLPTYPHHILMMLFQFVFQPKQAFFEKKKNPCGDFSRANGLSSRENKYQEAK